MNLADLFDPSSAAIVVVGTLLATTLRCGLHDSAVTLRALGGLGRSHFDVDHVRADLAVQVQEISQRGILRTEPQHMGDSEFDDVSETLIERRSIPALLAAHEGHKARRQSLSERAVRTLAQAAELAPVAGLAGTLLALSQLGAADAGLSAGGGNYAGNIAMAVQTTLYGLLFANLLLAPLARMVDRAAAAEEAERQTVVDWLADQVASACQPGRLAA
jgi:chemotaxis protein MotA